MLNWWINDTFCERWIVFLTNHKQRTAAFAFAFWRANKQNEPWNPFRFHWDFYLLTSIMPQPQSHPSQLHLNSVLNNMDKGMKYLKTVAVTAITTWYIGDISLISINTKWVLSRTKSFPESETHQTDNSIEPVRVQNFAFSPAAAVMLLLILQLVIQRNDLTWLRKHLHLFPSILTDWCHWPISETDSVIL